jgi:hypothetical protein
MLAPLQAATVLLHGLRPGRCNGSIVEDANKRLFIHSANQLEQVK